MNKWKDQYGNIKANSHQLTSENPSTFNATYNLMKEHVHRIKPEIAPPDYESLRLLNRNKWYTNGRYMTMEFDVDKIEEAKKNKHRSPDRFSIDEMMGVAATSRRYGHYENLKKLSYFRVYSFRPDGLGFLLMCRNPILACLFGGTMGGLAYLSAYQATWWGWLLAFIFFNYIPQIAVPLAMIVSCMRKPQDTSGKQLAYIRYRGLDMKWTWKICMKFLSNNSMKNVFAIYFPEHDHPINELAREIWE